MRASTVSPTSTDGARRSSRWNPTVPRKRPVGVTMGGSQTYTWAAEVIGMSGFLMRASTSATEVSGVTMRGSEVIRPPAVFGPYRSSRRRSSAWTVSIAVSRRSRCSAGNSPSRSAASSGCISSTTSAPRSSPRLASSRTWSASGISSSRSASFSSSRAAAIWSRRLGGRPSTAVARSAGCSSRSSASCSVSGSVLNSSGYRSQSTISGPRFSRRRPCETASAETCHPTRCCSFGLMATSAMVPSVTCCPISSEARVSPSRRVKRSRSTEPPSRWAPSTEISAICPRLTKMRRRCNVTTRPSARGGSLAGPGRITTSRIRPMVRPSLSSSGRPFSLDVNICWPAMTRHLLLAADPNLGPLSRACHQVRRDHGEQAATRIGGPRQRGSAMTTAATGIFSPIQVGTMSLGHRLVVPPHSGGGGALLGTEDQFDRMCRYWLAGGGGVRQWAGGGPVFVRNPLIPGFEPSGIGANADGFFRHPAFVDRMGRYMDRLHAAGGFGTVQMVLQGGMPIAPSQTLSGYLDHAIPHRLDLDEIAWLVREYGASAALAAQAGADAIELHSNHDDVLQWFLSPRTNRRDDRYGGGIEGRRRIVREVCEAIRSHVGRPITLGLRLCLDEGVDGGY